EPRTVLVHLVEQDDVGIPQVGIGLEQVGREIDALGIPDVECDDPECIYTRADHARGRRTTVIARRLADGVVLTRAAPADYQCSGHCHHAERDAPHAAWHRRRPPHHLGYVYRYVLSSDCDTSLRSP